MENRIKADKAAKIETAVGVFDAAGIEYKTTDRMHFRLGGGRVHYWPSTSHMWDEARLIHQNFAPKDVVRYLSCYYSRVASDTEWSSQDVSSIPDILSKILDRIEALEEKISHLPS